MVSKTSDDKKMPDELKMRTLSYATATDENGTKIESYAPLPLLLNDVITNPGFDKMDERITCLGPLGQFGYRYLLKPSANKTPYSLFLIYDESGIVAGIGSTFPRSVIEGLKRNVDQTGWRWVEEFMMNWMFHSEKLKARWDSFHALFNRPVYTDGYTVTAFFADIYTICEKDQRTTIDLKENGFMSSLLIRNGSIPNQVKYIAPHKWETELKPTLWVKGGCTSQSGQYYWYNIGKTMDCLTFQPVFVLYDGKGVLTGFGWFVFGRYDGFEHPSIEELEPMFGGNMPQCLADKLSSFGVSVRHIFLNKMGQEDMCKSRK